MKVLYRMWDAHACLNLGYSLRPEFFLLVDLWEKIQFLVGGVGEDGKR